MLSRSHYFDLSDYFLARLPGGSEPEKRHDPNDSAIESTTDPDMITYVACPVPLFFFFLFLHAKKRYNLFLGMKMIRTISGQRYVYLCLRGYKEKGETYTFLYLPRCPAVTPSALSP